MKKDMEQLIAAARNAVAAEIKAEGVADAAVDALNKRRSKDAAELAERRYGVKVGRYIDTGQHVVLVREIRCENVMKYAFRESGHKPFRDIAESRLFAHGVRINRSTGKPLMRRGGYRQASVVETSERVQLTDEVRVVAAVEVEAKRKKAAKSDVLKKLEKLDPATLAELAKKAGLS